MAIVTVVVASYNRKHLLEQTLQSLTRQSYTNFEVIMVDHGSTDQTEEVFHAFSSTLSLSYYKIEREGAFAAGVPKDYGVRKARTPLIIFIDTGSIVPPGYIEAHVTFHQQHPNAYGIGLQHGYNTPEDFTELPQEQTVEAFEQAYQKLKQRNLQDQRSGFDLEHSDFPWFFAWGANLSFPRAAYLAAGGFDLSIKGWGFEDAELSYKMYKYGLHLAFVENGWMIELPQARSSMRDRGDSLQKNMLYCYSRHKSLAMEALNIIRMLVWKAIGAYRTLPNANMAVLSEANLGNKMRLFSENLYDQQAQEAFHYLTELGQEQTTRPHLPPTLSAKFAGPTLLIGGHPEDAEWCNYVTLLDEHVVSTSSIWSCCGVLLPCADQSLGTVIISDIWKKLNKSFEHPLGIPPVSLLELLLSEIQRTSKHAVFLDTPSVRTGLTVDALKDLCKRYTFSVEVLSSDELEVMKGQQIQIAS